MRLTMRAVIPFVWRYRLFLSRRGWGNEFHSRHAWGAYFHESAIYFGFQSDDVASSLDRVASEIGSANGDYMVVVYST